MRTNMAEKKEKRTLTLLPGAALYAFLFLFSLFMTQLLRSVVSSVFFWFIFACLPVSAIITLICRASIQVYVFADKSSIEKLSDVEYEIRVINNSPIPCPFVDVIMTKPQDSGVRCVRQRLVLSLVPFGGYSVKTTVKFRYRGLYEIGVEELYITDPLRIFKLRTDIHNYSNVTVAPRSLEFDSSLERAVTDAPSPTPRTVLSREMAEVSNIREYRMGDTMKSIHWKLSSKSEELQVKDYNLSNDRHTYIFVDLSEPARQETADENAAPPAEQITSRPRHVSVKSKAVSFFRAVLQKHERYRRYRLRAKGNNRKNIETIEMIDALIYETSAKGKAKRAKEAMKNKNDAYDSEEAAMQSLSDAIEAEALVNDDKASVAVGKVKPEFYDEMPEYCADGVVEIAVAAVMKELTDGNRCTVAWYDKRSESGISVVDVADATDFKNTVSQFACAPVAESELRVSELVGIIEESVNVNIKIVTANIDPASVNEYCYVSSMFGGAGSGCATEILLFDPIEKYTDMAQRLEYTSSVRLQLKQSGVEMADIKERISYDNKIHLYNSGI